ncbi:MAG: ArsA family ATPase [Actinobacteria bacterium]|nr:MAG: ArsA family ATPase [Actinomycetota bacterium]
MEPPRIILYTGKGGVGKTSVAAATARQCAAGGLRTVVMSTDPAHSLSDSFRKPLGGEPTRISKRLFGQEVQAQREMEVHWGAVQRWLGQILADRPRGLHERLRLSPGRGFRGVYRRPVPWPAHVVQKPGGSFNFDAHPNPGRSTGDRSSTAGGRRRLWRRKQQQQRGPAKGP